MNNEILKEDHVIEDLLTLSIKSVSELYPRIEEYRERLDIAPDSVLHYVLMGAVAGLCAGVDSMVPHAN